MRFIKRPAINAISSARMFDFINFRTNVNKTRQLRVNPNEGTVQPRVSYYDTRQTKAVRFFSDFFGSPRMISEVTIVRSPHFDDAFH